MSITNFVPTIWSESLKTALDQQYVGVANCNREYEGEIKEKGSVVKICGVGNVEIGSYIKNANMNLPQDLNDTSVELNIANARYFNFQIDDIDRAQCSPKLMDAAMKVAAEALSKEADKMVYSLYYDHENIYHLSGANADNILNFIINARQKLFEAGVFDQNEVVLEVSPAIATMLYKSHLNIASNNNEILENGYIGQVAGCKVFVTNNLTVNEEGYHMCFMRTKRAIAFAEQISEVEAYRPERRFADAVKGLHLFGTAVVYPDELLVLAVQPAVE